MAKSCREQRPEGGEHLFIDAREVPENTIIEAEVCIVGAGAAGITLAREFAGESFRVCLLESGGLELDKETQSLSEGETVGLPYYPLHTARLRYFGGTTNHWGGWCRPLDEIDFERRDWVPHSGWPFPKAHLDPFYERAQPLCQLGPFAYDAEAWEDRKERPRLPLAGDRVITRMWQIGPPTRFGAEYRNVLARAANIRTYLNANVVEIEATQTAQRVTRVGVACLQGSTFWVAANLIILAAGGIENPRLLMLSNAVQRTGLGNQHDLVGRFFMEHPQLWSGPLLLSDAAFPMTLYALHTVKKTAVAGCVALAEEVQRREELLNACVLLEPQPLGAGAAPGAAAVPGFPSQTIRRGGFPDDFETHLDRVIADIGTVALAANRNMQRPPARAFRLLLRPEPSPNPESRVTLASVRDRLGKRRARLLWQLHDWDQRSLSRTQEIVAQEVGRAGLGRLRVTRDDDETAPASPREKVPWTGLQGSYHHMGTTSMHVDPKQGVVDGNCRVHGVSNLFIAGSSVFPTAGYANPTLTIVALAVRLADHVKALIK